MDIIKVVDENKEKKIVNFLVDINWSNFISVYELIRTEIENACTEQKINKEDDTFGDILLCGTLTEGLINRITSILIDNQEYELLVEQNRSVIKKAVFESIFLRNISPIFDSYIENGEHKIVIYDSSYVPF